MRFIVSTFAVVGLTALPIAALAQDSPAPAAATDVSVKATVPGPLAPADERLDSLFAKLKTERDADAARGLATEIRQALAISQSATVDFLMQSASRAGAEKRYGAALDFLDQVTLLAPDYAEGWNQRATIHYLLGNHAKAMSDSARVLTLEPRHIGALSGVAGILQDAGRDQQALTAWEAYLVYYPADREAQGQVLELMNRLAGQKT